MEQIDKHAQIITGKRIKPYQDQTSIYDFIVTTESNKGWFK